MSNTLSAKLKKIIAVLLALVSSLSPSVSALASGEAVSEEELNLNEENFDDSLSGGLTINNFFWPDAEGRYYVSFDEATDSNDYMLFVVVGKYENDDLPESDDLVRNIIYVDQAKASSGKVSFNGFKPSREANATVIISGQGMLPSVLGYISRDYFKVNGYCASENPADRIGDSYIVSDDLSYGEVISKLPSTAYALIESEFTENVYAPVDLSWECTESYSSGRGKTYAFVGDASLAAGSGLPEGVESLLKPLNITVTVYDKEASLVGITVTKSKVIYEVGETIDISDVSVRGIYDDGTVRNTDDWTGNISELSTQEPGTQTLKITAGNYTKEIKLSIVEDLSNSGVYTVSFDTRGGSYTAPVVVGDKLKAFPEKPVKNGYRFTGWYTDSLCKELFDLATVITGDITLYAGWENKLAVNPLSLTVSLERSTVTVDEPLKESEICVTVNYSDGSEEETDAFSSNILDIDQSVSGDKNLLITANIKGIPLNAEAVFYVIDTENTLAYTVSFDTGIEDEEIKTVVVMAGMPVSEPEVPNRPGYIFDGWYLNKKQWNFTKAVSSDMTLTAKWLVGELIGEEGSNFYVYTEERQTYTYTGSAIKPNPIVLDNYLNVLSNKKDYTVSYENNKNASTVGYYAKLKVTGKGNYTGTIERSFIIDAKDVEDGLKISLGTSYAYNAKGVKPLPTIKMGKKKLSINKDYTVSYRKLSDETDTEGVEVSAPLKDAGFYKVIIKGINNFSGTKAINIIVGKKGTINLSKATVSIDKKGKNVPYTGAEITIDDFVKVKGKSGKKSKTLSPTDDYMLVYEGDHTNPGTVKVTVKAREDSSNCYGSKTFTFNITGIAMKDAKLSMKTASFVYDGKLHNDNLGSVSLKVTKANKDLVNRFSGGSYSVNSYYTLVEGKDYSVKYSNALNVGTVKVTVKGMGVFSGTASGTYKITQRNLTDKNITVNIDEAEVSKAGAEPKIEIRYYSTDSEILLKKGTDYKVSLSKNTSVTNAAVAKITGKGNFKGNLTKKFSVSAKDIRNKDISVTVNSVLTGGKVKAGGKYKPSIVVKDKNKVLKENKDYSVNYSGCVTFENMQENDVCEGYVVISGKGKNYTGVARYYYKTTKADISKATVTVKDQIYTGKAITFDEGSKESIKAILILNGEEKELVLGKDFKIVSYSKNKAAGTASVVLQGINDYAGTKTVKFKITKCPIH